jgi:disulfide bond formation protein DsbB
MSDTSTLSPPAAARGLWSTVAYWGLHAWILGYTFVMLSAFYIQLVEGEFPCPLCMLQRYGMFFSTMGALFVVMQARRGTLTASRYSQGLGMGIVGAVAGGSVSWRQINLHIKPGDSGYGEPVLGLHLYTWALITFVIVIIYCGVMLMLMPKGIPEAPAEDSPSRLASTVVVWIFLAVAVANVIAIILLEGFAFALPDDPNSYNLIDQLTGR